MLNLKICYYKFLLICIPLFLIAQLFIKNVEVKKNDWQNLFKELNQTIINQQKTLTDFKIAVAKNDQDYQFISRKIPILVFGCNRPTITRTLDQLLKLRPSKDLFPIYVSLGCSNSKLEAVLNPYKNNLTILKHKQKSNDPKISKWQQGYYHISYHYKWALDLVFATLQNKNDALIIVEVQLLFRFDSFENNMDNCLDDFDLAPDFFEYFRGTYPLLIQDSTIWCISCWNDNGLPNLIVNNSRLLHRTDFFPGLGWMMTKALWSEVGPKWPSAFWDDWMRDPVQRRNRSCVRPELSRVYTFGDRGVSKGQYFESHLGKIALNPTFVPFTREPELIRALIKDNYDPKFTRAVYHDSIAIRVDELVQKLGPVRDETRMAATEGTPSYRIHYDGQEEFKTLADSFGLMSDFRGGVARTSYLGVVTFMFRGHRIYLVDHN